MTDIYAGIPTQCILDEVEIAKRHKQLPTPLQEQISKLLDRGYKYLDVQEDVAIAEMGVFLARELQTVNALVAFFHMTEEQRYTTSYALMKDSAMAYMLDYHNVSKAATQARWLVEYEERIAKEGRGKA
jgi:hypothetical protein